MTTELTPLQTTFHWRRLRAVSRTPHGVTQGVIDEQIDLLQSDHLCAQITRDHQEQMIDEMGSQIAQRDRLISDQTAEIERLNEALAQFRTPETALEPATVPQIDLVVYERLAHQYEVIEGLLDEYRDSVEQAFSGSDDS